MVLMPLFAWAETVVYYVDQGFQGENPTGESWLSAYPSLQQAIDAAGEKGGGEVWVKSGVHKPLDSTRNATFTLKPGVALYGGFRGNETSKEARNHKSNRTVLSGDVGRMSSTADNCYHVLTGCADIHIDGFIISRGNADSADAARLGGALLLPEGADKVSIANCTFEKNNAVAGGAIYLHSGALTVSNCAFYSNSSETGGAIFVDRESAKLTAVDCAFSSSFAPENGGAVYLGANTEALFERCMFNYNSTDGRGGAIFADAEDKENGMKLEVRKGIFRQNIAKVTGGALAFKGAFIAQVSDSLFEANRSGQGAAAISNESGISAIIKDNTFVKNRSVQGSEDVAVDHTSRLVESAEEAQQLIAAAKAREQALADANKEPEPEPPRQRQLADVYVYNTKGIMVKLRSIVAEADYTVLVLGDLTDNDFLTHYRNIEAAAHDYYSQKIRFYYLYKYLTHPQNHGYVEPFRLQERARHTKLAKENLLTKVPWLFDVMDNQAAAALGTEADKSVLLFDAAGNEHYAGNIRNSGELRKALSTITGKANNRTKASALPNTDMNPIRMKPVRYTKRIKISSDAGFQPLELTPIDSKTPHYVKLRAEGNRNLLTTGNGKLLLSFNMDPLYPAAWNNMGDPVKYAIKVPSGVVAPSVNSAKRVTATPTDTEPREFLIDARKLDTSKPITLQVSYSVHSNSSKKNITVTQQYILYLQPDPFGGMVLRDDSSKPAAPAPVFGASRGNAFGQMLKRYDDDRNGKLSSDEVFGPLRRGFDDADLNKDGFIDEREYFRYRNNR